MMKPSCKTTIVSAISVVIILLLSSTKIAFGLDVSQLKLDIIDIRNGLSQNSIRAIYQDSRGYMWFCTQDGLNRYDGYSFLKIKKEGLSNNLISNYTNCMVESKPGLFWIGTEKGLSIYDFDNRIFINSDAQLKINKIYIEDSVTAWLESSNSLYRAKLVTIQKSDKVSYSIKIENLFNYRELLINNKNSFIISGKDNKLYTYNLSTKITKLKSSFFTWQKLIPKKISVVTKDIQQNYWIGTNDGLYRCDKNLLSVDSFMLERQKVTGIKDKITDIKIDRNGNVYIATYQNGILYYDSKRNKFTEIQYDPYDLNGLPDNKINCLFFDNSGTFWIGTKGAGIAVFSPYKYKFQHITQEPYKSTWLNNKYILSFEEDNQNNIWIGTDGGGLFKYNTTDNIFSNWRNNSSAYSLSNDIIQDLLYDNASNLWVGTLNGVCKYVPERNVFLRYYLVPNHSKENLRTPKYFHIRLFQSAHGKVYAITENEVFIFNPTKNQFESNPFQFTSKATTTLSIIEDDDYTQWVASATGLYHIDIEKGFLDEAALSKINKTYFSTDQLYALLKIENDKIWIATGNNGLYLFNTITKKIINNINQSDGLSNNFIYGILLDDQNKLWMSSNLGISTYESTTHKIRNFDVNDGLQSNEFNSGAFYKTKNNDLLFGGINGFNIIQPNNIPFNNFRPSVNISSVRVNDFPFHIPNYQLTDKPIKFDNNQNTFEFEFSSGDYANVAKNTFEYKLNGFDKTWIKTNRHYASYPKLPHGNYTFYVRAGNNDGIYSSSAAQFHFIIKPMFWQTWIFRIFVALIIVYYLYRTIINFLSKARRRDKEKMKIEKQKSEYEKQLAEIKLKALVSQMNPHFIFNCMNSIQAMILSDQNMQASTYLTKLSRLVRAVLENSVKTFVPLNEVIDNLKLYLELESLRFDQQFNYDIKTENIDIYSVELPSMLIQPYVENAIWHGLLKKTGEKDLQIRFYTIRNSVFCEIIDNGIGRVNAQTMNLKKQHQSLGTKITQEMFDTLNKIKQATYKADIIDMYDENNLPIGTKVIIEMEL